MQLKITFDFYTRILQYALEQKRKRSLIYGDKTVHMEFEDELSFFEYLDLSDLTFYITKAKSTQSDLLYTTKLDDFEDNLNDLLSLRHPGKLHTTTMFKNNQKKFINYVKMYNKLSLLAMKKNKPSILFEGRNYTALKTKPTFVKEQNKTGFWLNYYSFYPLQCIFNTKLTIVNFNILEAAKKKEFRIMLKNALKVFSFLKLNRVVARFIATIYSTLVLKDSKALATFIRLILREVHYKKHTFYFSFVGQLVHEIIKPQLHKFDCLGISIVFRGKLGIGGNARKRALKYHTGVISSSSKYVKLSRYNDVVRTKTGIVGFTVIVAW